MRLEGEDPLLEYLLMSPVKFSHENRLIRDFLKMTGLTQHESREREISEEFQG